MKVITKLFFIVLFAFLISGCATSGPKFVEMKNSMPNILLILVESIYIVHHHLELQFSQMLG